MFRCLLEVFVVGVMIFLEFWGFTWFSVVCFQAAGWSYVRYRLVGFLGDKYLRRCLILLVFAWSSGKVLRTGLVRCLIRIRQLFLSTFSLFANLNKNDHVRPATQTYVIGLLTEIMTFTLLAATVLDDRNSCLALNTRVFTQNNFLLWQNFASGLSLILWLIFCFFFFRMSFLAVCLLRLCLLMWCQMFGYKRVRKFILRDCWC